jgi:hypothetical protein
MKYYKLFATLHDTSESTYHRCGISLLVLMLLSIVAQWAVSPVPLVATPHDIMFPLDAGWRVLSGQVPHNDFYSGLGPAFSYLYAIGVRLFGPTISAIVNINLMMMAITTLLAWLISRPRLNPFLALLFSATVMMTTSGVEPLGWGANATDYAMSYTRHAFGILMCVCLGCFFPAHGHISKIVDGAEDVLIGALVSFLLLFKINFFVIAAAAIVIRPLIVDFTPKRFAWVCLGFLLPVFFFWLVLGVSPEAFLNDMSLMYKLAMETSPPLLQTVWALILDMALSLSTIILIIVAAGYVCFVNRKGDFPELARSFVVVSFLFAADLALGITNTQLPILVFLPMISLIALRELLMINSHGRSYVLSAMVILTLFLSTLTVIRESSYIGYAFWRKHSADPVDVQAQRFNSPLLKNVYVPSGINWLSNYPLIVNDGLRLLKKHIAPGNKLVTLSFSNPFDFLLGLQPASGGSLCWHEGVTFTYSNHPQADRVFSNADFVVIDNQTSTKSYDSYLQKHFALIDQSEYWSLLKRFSP